MRITNKVMNNNMLINLNKGMARMDKLQQQLASGKRVHKPSDDPGSVSNIMHLKSSLSKSEQYLGNVESGLSWLESTDTVLDAVTNVIHRARELAVYGASDSLDSTARDALASEIEQLYDNVVQLANSTHENKYLFAGQNTSTKPFVKEGTFEDNSINVNYYGGYTLYDGEGEIDADYASLNREISVNAQMPINIIEASKNEGEDEAQEKIFSPILDALVDIQRNLIGGNTQELGNSDLESLDNATDKLLRYRSEVGAKINRLELTKERFLDLKINLSQLMSNSADVDVAETIMQLKFEENIYNTALSVGARIIQPSLVDFLR